MRKVKIYIQFFSELIESIESEEEIRKKLIS